MAVSVDPPKIQPVWPQFDRLEIQCLPLPPKMDGTP